MIPKLMGETWRKYPTETSKQKTTYGLFQCQYCGKEFETMVSSIHSGSTKSCGCQHHKPREKSIKHGLRSNRFYSTWYGMVKRCNNLKSKDYKNYGARGITICADWLDVRNFIAWCDVTHPKLEGYTLDRINNDKGYSPENCTWSDKTTQILNRRIMKNNKSGFVGVSFGPLKNRWVANIGVNGKQIRIGSFKDKMDAVQARDNYITQNKLPHKLNME